MSIPLTASKISGDIGNHMPRQSAQVSSLYISRAIASELERLPIDLRIAETREIRLSRKGGAPYMNAPDPHSLLAERIESLVSQEHAKWAPVQQQELKPKTT